jgi:V/A-type H+-transporting ATPase subunit C
MSSVVKFAAINTKVKVLEGQLLSNYQYQQVLNSRNYKDALKYLKENTAYANALKAYNVDDVHRGQLEIILKKDYIKKYNKLIHYFDGEYKKIIKTLFLKFEIEDIKTILRGKFIGKENEELYSFLAYESSLSNLNYKSLIDASNYTEVINKLKDTIYYKHIVHLVKYVQDEGLFRIEMALDFIYFIHLRKAIKKLDKENMEILKEIIGRQADLLNIQWIFRGKKYYKLAPEELLNYTIYDGYKLNKDILKQLCYTKSMNEFFVMVDTLPYGELFNKTKYREYLLEKEILSYLKAFYDKMKREHRMNISVAIAYLELALQECRDIITLVENKRYNVENDEALKYITATL